jgi:glycerol-3-phosphate acyltransferase PlsY
VPITGIVFAVCAVAAYLLGAVPSGLIVGRARGVDIRSVGSGNIGATNVVRVLGKKWGAVTFVCDASKGFVPAFVFPFLAGRFCEDFPSRYLAVVCACLAIAGHNWPLYLRFKGGKGVATSAGALLGIAPTAMGIGLAAWLVMFTVTRYVSVASLTAATVLPVSAWLLYAKDDFLIPITLTVLSALIMFRHKANIRRLMEGTENRFERKKKETTARSEDNV